MDEIKAKNELVRIIREKQTLKVKQLQISFINSEYYAFFGVPADSTEQNALIYQLADDGVISLELSSPVRKPAPRLGAPAPYSDVLSARLTDRDLIMCATLSDTCPMK